MERAIDISHERDHYVVRIDGEFFCTADTYHEAIKELQEEGYLN